MSRITPPLSITPLHTIAEMAEVEEVQRLAWGYGERALEITPRDTLLAVAHAGGIMLGCRDASGTLLGFVYSFMSWDTNLARGRVLRHWSHQMGVIPQARGHGVAQQLKLAQRVASLEQGVELICWTYDPLEPVNARLNIGRLRAIARRYSRNHYGEMAGINAGLPSDRFEVEWWLQSSRVRAALDGRPPLPHGLPSFAATLRHELPAPYEDSLPLDGSPLEVEVPASFQQLKQRDKGLALQWRLASRAWFEQAFACGYAAVDAYQRDGRAFYVLAPFDDEAT
jgi:predicted GNAT superfamily acetyltransferase